MFKHVSFFFFFSVLLRHINKFVTSPSIDCMCARWEKSTSNCYLRMKIPMKLKRPARKRTKNQRMILLIFIAHNSSMPDALHWCNVSKNRIRFDIYITIEITSNAAIAAFPRSREKKIETNSSHLTGCVSWNMLFLVYYILHRLCSACMCVCMGEKHACGMA